MKRVISGLLVLCLISLSCMLASCGKEKPNIEDFPGVDIPEDYDDSTTQYNIGNIVSDMTELKNIESAHFVRGVSTGEALLSVLASGKDDIVKLSGSTDESITVPSANYSDATLIIDAPGASLGVGAEFEAIAVYSVNDSGIEFSGKTGVFAVFGADVKVDFSGSADTFYIEGKNCVLTLTGNCGKIVNINSETEIINNTQSDIAVTSSSGAEIIIPAGGTLSGN